MAVSGLSAGTYGFGNNDMDRPAIFSHINVEVGIEKRQSQLTLQTKVSAVEVVLRYTDFSIILAVLHENLGETIERRNWDNLEVAWEEEVLRDNSTNGHESPHYSKDVSYSENARRIRYGQSSSSSGENPLELLLGLNCESMSLLVHRDDDMVTENGSNSGYGIVLLAIRQLIASMKREDGEENVSLSLGEVFIFDVGESARALHRGQGSRALPHSVMVEGYSTPNDCNHFDSQVVVTIDRTVAFPDDLNISILVNYLSVAALLRPLEEVFSFFSCTWTVSSLTPSSAVESISLDDRRGSSVSSDISNGEQRNKPSGSTLKLKFVLHYARFIFAADESDRNSRALVLEG